MSKWLSERKRIAIGDDPAAVRQEHMISLDYRFRRSVSNIVFSNGAEGEASLVTFLNIMDILMPVLSAPRTASTGYINKFEEIRAILSPWRNDIHAP